MSAITRALLSLSFLRRARRRLHGRSRPGRRRRRRRRPRRRPAARSAAAPTAAVYVRGSLAPLFQLTPRAEYGRIEGRRHHGRRRLRHAPAPTSSPRRRSSTRSRRRSPRERGSRGRSAIVNDRRSPARPADPVPRQPVRRRDPAASTARARSTCRSAATLMTPGNEVASVDPDTGAVHPHQGRRPARADRHPPGRPGLRLQPVLELHLDHRLRAPTSCCATTTGPVEITTEYYCTDLAFVARNVAAPTSTSRTCTSPTAGAARVLKYGLTVVRDGISDERRSTCVVDRAGDPDDAGQPAGRRDHGRRLQPVPPVAQRGPARPLRRQQPRRRAGPHRRSRRRRSPRASRSTRPSSDVVSIGDRQS